MSDIEIERKLDGIFSISIDPAADFRDLVRRLHAALGEYVVALNQGQDRDIDRVEVDLDPAFPNIAIYRGYWGKRCRVELGIRDCENGDLSIALTATKGAADVDSTDWGDSGGEIGNSVVVGRMLHVGICALRGAGVQRLINQPYNKRLRAYYSALGFIGGEILPLDDRKQLEIALFAIRKLYAPFGLDIAAPPP